MPQVWEILHAVSINDPITVEWDDKRQRYYLLQGRETFYNEKREWIQFDTREQAENYRRSLMTSIIDRLIDQDPSLTLSEQLDIVVSVADELLEALEYIVNDIPEPGEDAELTAKGYNMACRAIRKAKGE